MDKSRTDELIDAHIEIVRILLGLPVDPYHRLFNYDINNKKCRSCPHTNTSHKSKHPDDCPVTLLRDALTVLECKPDE